MIAAEATKPKQVLIVEDENGTAILMKKLLEKNFDVEVDVAEDIVSAREKLAACSFDIVTLDYFLPDGYGSDLLQVLAEMPDRPAVIVVTGQTGEKMADSFREIGVDCFIVKNQAMTGLLTEAVGRVLGGEAQA